MAYDTFGGLNILQTLSLYSNPCTTNDDQTSDQTKLLALIRKVEENCDDTNYFMYSTTKQILEYENLKLKAEIAKLREGCSSQKISNSQEFIDFEMRDTTTLPPPD